jgi:type VI protein secretion system component VasF
VSGDLPRELRDAGEDLPPRRRRPVWHRVIAGLVVAAMVVTLLLYTGVAFF